MKKIKWQNCERQGAMATYTGQEKVPSWADPVTPGLHVDARYSDLNVHLRIKEEIRSHIFSATVMYFDPVGAPIPKDLSEDDEVEISRESICFLHKP